MIEKYFLKLTHDFHTNKCVCANQMLLFLQKDSEPKIAGFLNYLMRRMQKRPIRGISTKLQDEQWEICDNYVPKVQL
ncbi:hypothetical protein MXB_4600 [Myxobolus squamalis]|nr:hypothetical protein MXB_4600 [Myxobolus squamalis]